MKSHLIISAKYRSGSTTLTCLARHLQCACHWRVQVLDLAEPPRCAWMLARYPYDAIASGKRAQAPQECRQPPSGGCVHVLDAHSINALQSRDDPARTRYYANLRRLLTAVSPWFDVCLVDAPALPDLRAVCTEALVDAVLSPLAVSPDCINGASEVINGRYGMRNIRARLNPALHVTGILPVVTVPAAKEEAWAKVLELREWLIADPASPRGSAWLPHLACALRIKSITAGETRSVASNAGGPSICGWERPVSMCSRAGSKRSGTPPSVPFGRRRHAMHDATTVTTRAVDIAVVVRALLQVLRRGWIVLAACLGMSIMSPGSARADDWGCQVILCLSNPGGPEQYGECVPPVERLWAALRHGDPFPTCDFGAGGSQGTSAANIFASAGYCREDLLYWGGPEQGELLCNARGAINVEIDGVQYTRVWWDTSGTDRTITEFYGAGSMATPYDPTQSARLFVEREYESSGGEGGGE